MPEGEHDLEDCPGGVCHYEPPTPITNVARSVAKVAPYKESAVPDCPKPSPAPAVATTDDLNIHIPARIAVDTWLLAVLFLVSVYTVVRAVVGSFRSFSITRRPHA